MATLRNSEALSRGGSGSSARSRVLSQDLTPREKFQTLDALRGVAALVVLIYHVGNRIGLRVFPHGGFAVDLFFILSGFVVAHAYGARLAAGWGMKGFLAARLRRLYPLYALGLALGAVVYALIHGVGPGLVSPTLLGALFLPASLSPGADAHAYAYALNSAAWSLVCEIAINVAYAAVAPRLTTGWLMAIVGLGAAALVSAALHDGDTNGGFLVGNVLSGYARVLFGFPCGVLLYRLHRSGELARFAGVCPRILVGILLGLAALPQASATIDLLVVLIALPFLVAAAAQAATLGAAPLRVSAGLAALSYPLYATHIPLLTVGHVLYARMATPVALQAALDVGICVGAAALALKFFDQPLQRRLAALSAGFGRSVPDKLCIEAKGRAVPRRDAL